jgi:hypothetical protein
VPNWYHAAHIVAFGFGASMLFTALDHPIGTGEIALGIGLVVLSPLSLYFGGPFGVRPYGR